MLERVSGFSAIPPSLLLDVKRSPEHEVGGGRGPGTGEPAEMGELLA